MKFLTVASGVLLAVTGTIAQLTAPMQNYNVSSPVSNGPYVAGRILPCTVEVFANVASDIALSVSLASTTNTSISYVITSTLDTSKTSDSYRTKNNVSYYEHSYNYNIPTTITPGTYNVVFLDSKTNTHLDVPITILPVTATSAISLSAGATAAASATSSSQGSIFKNDAASAMSTTKSIYLAAGAAAAALAILL
ncbi:hypothetical protein G6F46_012481 [Rhizopus delemar]|uniref:Uncharacterized protein n=3 Tax=Rhizopus TaxID=4842 RepID=I1CPN1_RHIO9|nr:hypothetical protein RO3G_15122 [Rhizopus delemar RA 99-880]KAG1443473.1 hypothetical protein G6F55_012651 [Rhizopus delemar]KAG1532804.1 hypothetical protein G6F51_012928 [Rhizopus arrhizus]KAG1493171.1 hypothetical protein G6F53_012806 [Rhizopus delemar]KAG1499677.1 hypothetical protein G6F54_004250 [Rhizopus delemar]|eukprot:EIE90411.1 hypothetical protein RO3G_15122 [Rhizopus delemar RA 99-880]